jgi:hypothetical protein
MPFVLRPPGEAAPLTAQLRALAAERGGVMVATGLFRCVILLILGVALAGLFDALIHWNSWPASAPSFTAACGCRSAGRCAPSAWRCSSKTASRG